jgi:hypothetical protein
MDAPLWPRARHASSAASLGARTDLARAAHRPRSASHGPLGAECDFGLELSASCAGLWSCLGLDVTLPMSQAPTFFAAAGPSQSGPLDGAFGATCSPGGDCALRTCVAFTCGS